MAKAKKSDKPAGELSDKAQARMNEVIARFESGDLGPVVTAAKLKLPESWPTYKWSTRNKALVVAQLGTLNVRTYNQWQEMGRQVQKGARGGFAWKGMKIEKKNDNGEVEKAFMKFSLFSVFSCDDTDGDVMPEQAHEVAPPPLMHVAERMGLDVKWEPGDGPSNGYYMPSKDVIRIHVDTDGVGVGTFFHELAHAVQNRLFGLGNYAQDEVVAELTAASIASLYGYDDRINYSWEYIKGWASAVDSNAKPIDVVKKVIDVTGQILDYIMGMAEDPQAA